MVSYVDTIVDALVGDIADAWELPPESKIFVDPPRLPEVAAPYATIALDGVERTAAGGRHTDELQRFQITGVFPIRDTDRSLLTSKVALARALAAKLTPDAIETNGIMPVGGHYTPAGWNGFIPSVSFEERFDLTEPVFTVALTFEVMTTSYE